MLHGVLEQLLGIRLHAFYGHYSAMYVALNYVFNGVGGKKFS